MNSMFSLESWKSFTIFKEEKYMAFFELKIFRLLVVKSQGTGFECGSIFTKKPGPGSGSGDAATILVLCALHTAFPSLHSSHCVWFFLYLAY
jgi:hypothetical protein